MKALVVLVMCVLFTAVFPATVADEQSTMSIEFTDYHVGWHAFLIEPSDDLVLRLLYWYGYSPNSVFYSFFDANGTFLTGSAALESTRRDGVRVRSEAAGIDESHFQPKTLNTLALGFEISMSNKFPRGTPSSVTLLVGAAGELEYWTLEKLAGSARVLAHAEGTRVFSASGTEFDGELNIVAGYSGVNLGYGKNTTYTFNVENRLISVYIPSYTNFLVKTRTGHEVDRVSITDPGGVDELCTCWWRDYVGPGSHGPGTYTYRLDAARVLFDVYVMGADVNIPWIQAD